MGRSKARRDARKTGAAAHGGRAGGLQTGGMGELLRVLLCAVVILAAGALVYANSFRGAFVLDDQIGIIQNQLIRFVLPVERFFESSQPLNDFTLAVNFALGELDPWGYHLVNLLVHLVAGLVLFGILRRTLGSPRIGERIRDRADILALMVTLAWLLHPIQTESVTYVIQRCESMAGMFFLLTLYSAIRCADAGSESARRRWVFAAVLSCACGMTSKAIVVTAPVVVLLYDRTFLSGGLVEALRRRWLLYAGLGATWLVLLGQGTLHGLLYEPGETATVGFGFAGVTPMEYLRTQPGVILHYLRLSVWPGGQCLDYGWPVATTTGAIIIPAVVIGFFLAVTVVATWRRSPLGFLGCWFLLILAPTSSFVPIKDLAFEHRMYLPLAAVVVLVVVGGRWVIERLYPRASEWPFRAAVAVALIGLAVLTVRRNALFADSVALWADTVQRAPENPRPRNALGYAWLARGEPEKAIEHFRAAIEIDPEFAAAHANIGKAHFSRGRWEEAATEFDAAWRIRPGEFFADTHFYYASALLQLGRHAESIEQFRFAISKNPQYGPAYYNLANTLWAKGDRESAVAVYQQALGVDPAYTEAAVNMGLVLAELGRVDEAIISYRNAIGRFTPGGRSDALTKAHYNLGLALQAQGKLEEAKAQFQQALRVNPGHEASRKALAGMRPGNS